MPRRPAATVPTATSKPRRLGRPPATDGAETRRRVMEVALGEFAERGYSDATLKDIAVKAELTTGAVYHYFASKSELFIAVAESCLERLNALLEQHSEGATTFVERLDAAFEVIGMLNARQPHMAPFMSNLDTESRRYPELQSISRRVSKERDKHYRQIIMDAVQSGELNPEINPKAVIDLLEVIRLGLTQFQIRKGSVARHQAVIVVLERLFEGKLYPTR